MAKGKLPRSDTTANLGFESRTRENWLTADKLRNNMDAAEYGHVVLDCILPLACGSGPANAGFVQSEKFVESHGDQLGHISSYGQESNATTRRLAVMNLALCGIEADFGPPAGAGPNTFCRDLHPDLRTDTTTHASANAKPRSHLAGFLRSERQLLATPPVNDSDWSPKVDDPAQRDWQVGVPPKGNANFAWVQHFIHHIAPQGMAGFVMANSDSSARAGLAIRFTYEPPLGVASTA